MALSKISRVMVMMVLIASIFLMFSEVATAVLHKMPKHKLGQRFLPHRLSEKGYGYAFGKGGDQYGKTRGWESNQYPYGRPRGRGRNHYPP